MSRIVWDHVDNQAYEKLLPCRIVQCTTDNNRVAIVLRGGDVVIWSPGHAAIQLELPQGDIRQARSCALFDPRNSKNLYLASGYPFRDGSTDMIRFIVHEFSEAIHIASWSSDCLDPDMYIEDSGQRYSNEYTSGLGVLITEYELDNSCIVFGWRMMGRSDMCLAVFDRIKRKFINRVSFEQNCLHGRGFDEHLNKNSIWSAPGFTLKEKMDLDFIVGFTPEGYKVTQLKLPQNTDDKEPCEDYIRETKT